MNKIIRKIADKTVVIKQKFIEKKDLIKKVSAISMVGISVLSASIFGGWALHENSVNKKLSDENQALTTENNNLAEQNNDLIKDKDILIDEIGNLDHKLNNSTSTLKTATALFVLKPTINEQGWILTKTYLTTSYDLEDFEMPKYYENKPIVTIGREAFSGLNIKQITIPNSVTSIGNSAFSGCKSLEQITIPNSVTSIGNSAFFGCKSLEQITIPDSVTSIGGLAFVNCESLKQITIPDSVTSIGNSAFSSCYRLTEINVDSANKNYKSKDGVLFNNDMTTLIQYPSENTLKNYVIPNSVTSIGNSAFSGCKSLEQITIPNSVTSIEQSAFSSCYRLTEINVDLANKNYKSKDGVLFNNDMTTLIQYPSENTLKNYVIPNSVTSIGNSAFSGCKSLEQITISDSVTSIEQSAFWGCSSLEQITIPDSVTSIGAFAFALCKDGVQVTIKETGKRTEGAKTSISCSIFSGTYVSTLNIPKGFDMNTLEIKNFTGSVEEWVEKQFDKTEIKEYSTNNTLDTNTNTRER